MLKLETLIHCVDSRYVKSFIRHHAIITTNTIYITGANPENLKEEGPGNFFTVYHVNWPILRPF